jgi:hypothetical protein
MAEKSSFADAPDPDDSRFLERVMRYLEDDLPEPGVAQLREELERDARKREIFSLVCISDTLAHEELRGILAANPVIDEYPETVAASGESMHDTMILPAIGRGVVASSDDDAISLDVPRARVPAKGRRSWMKYGGWAAVVILVVILGTAVFLMVHSPRKKAMVATLTSTVQAEWGDPSVSPPSDHQLRLGEEIDLQSGYAGMRFANATQLVAEGPVRMKLTGINSVELFSGKISVKMQPGQSGFCVLTPDCRVTDLGTEFGVIADAAVKATDVHVFSGRVQVAVNGSQPQTVTIGGLAHVTSGVIGVKADSSVQQLFVQDISQSTTPLELADLLSGGDGTEEHRGGVLDPGTGAFGIWGTLDPWYSQSRITLANDDGGYHRTSALPVVDGCFIPASGLSQQVDSAGDHFRFPAVAGASSMRLCVAGSVAPLPGGKTITPKLGDTNFSFAGHSYVMVCPNMGVTLDLASIHHIHPVGQISRFRCKFGSFGSAENQGKADLLVLVDGVQRFFKAGYTAQDGILAVDVPFAASDRFLTVVTTDSGAAGTGNNLFLGDAYLDQLQKR